MNYCKKGKTSKLQYFYFAEITAKNGKWRNCSTFVCYELLQKTENSEIAVLLPAMNYCKKGETLKSQYFCFIRITAKKG
ncbi:MAG: hypothetical protein IJS22_06100 [Lachnospiraceae bacterium]|nr:hypothetical protein [Lachnospiraceae bacterium]